MVRAVAALLAFMIAVEPEFTSVIWPSPMFPDP
jgi:hypothetical protein